MQFEMALTRKLFTFSIHQDNKDSFLGNMYIQGSKMLCTTLKQKLIYWYLRSES